MMGESKEHDMHQLLLKNWSTAVEAGNLELAFQIDMTHYGSLVKPTENLKAWETWQNDTYRLRKLVSGIELRPKEICNASPTASNNIAIYLPNFSGLAHEEVITSSIRYLKKNELLKDSQKFHIVFAFGKNEALISGASRFYSKVADEIHFLDAPTLTLAAVRFSELNKAQRFATIIYPSVFYFAFWSSLLINHSNQKFLVGKYYPLQLGRFSAFAGGRKDTQIDRLVNDERWIQLSWLGLDYFLSKDDLERAQHENSIARFGSISRVEKLRDDQYNNFVLDALEQHPSSQYLYTARESEIEALPFAIRDHPRSKNLGWVQPSEAIQYFDLYLEPFPFGGGLMSILAVARGLPYISLDSAQMDVMGITNFLKVIAEQSGKVELAVSFCDSQASLNDNFSSLLRSVRDRQDLGDAWRQAIRSYRPIDLNLWCDFYTH